MQSTEGPYDGTAAYARTKRGQVELAEDWARNLADDNIRVNSMHPGWVDTEGVRAALPTFRKFTRPLLRNEDQGADSAVWLIAARDADAITGKFIHDRKPRPTHRAKRTKTDVATSNEFVGMLTADAAPYITGVAEEFKEGRDATNR
jgi:dehydrogenase/reductase SDR family protein 12